jgi:hypothetical protein
MKNEVGKTHELGLSRRGLIQGAACTAITVAGLKSIAFGQAAQPPGSTDERDTVISALAFWVAVTNPALPKIDYQTLADVSGLPNNAALQKAVDRVKQQAQLYSNIVDEFTQIEKILSYGPGECPKHFNTLQQIAGLKPANMLPQAK